MTIERVKLADLSSTYLRQLQKQYNGKDLEVEIVLSTESAASERDAPMNEDRFWAVIKLLDWTKTGNDDAVIEPVVQHLSRLPEQAILTFFDLLSEKLYLLDGRMYADCSIEKTETISADLFLYARCCVVANGRDTFEAVLRSPVLFPKDLYFEAILDIPERAWFRKTGKNLDYLPKYIYETGFNPKGWGADTISL
jgi:Protein of unknown function (DUF4240)